MESQWLEDFVGLAEADSFSRVAQLRNMTQSAFARRIRALEHWAGTDLVDRSRSPAQFTSAGKNLQARARDAAGLAADARDHGRIQLGRGT